MRFRIAILTLDFLISRDYQIKSDVKEKIFFAFIQIAVGVLQCDNGEGCYFEPSSCNGDASQCQYAFTYKPYPDVKNATDIQFEIETKIDDSSSGQYMALGLSKDNSMVRNVT